MLISALKLLGICFSFLMPYMVCAHNTFPYSVAYCMHWDLYASFINRLFHAHHTLFFLTLLHCIRNFFCSALTDVRRREQYCYHYYYRDHQYFYWKPNGWSSINTVADNQCCLLCLNFFLPSQFSPFLSRWDGVHVSNDTEPVTFVSDKPSARG